MAALMLVNEVADNPLEHSRSRTPIHLSVSLHVVVSSGFSVLAQAQQRREGRAFLRWRRGRRRILFLAAVPVALVARRFAAAFRGRLRLGGGSRHRLIFGAHCEALAVEHRGLAAPLAAL